MDTPMFVDRRVSIARLHGQACWHCGAVTRSLVPAGTIVHGDSVTEWPIVSCGCAPMQAQHAEAPRTRHCTYCPRPGADACVRVRRDEDGGMHVYAHQACAEARNVPTLYVFTDEQSAREAQ
ncbi:hypothetical protein ACFYUJ_29555 [Streptomyces sp. NPDC004520]|uniref:hypothetical protein n=1 Tax=Streptomyces sp. NPDC004520 TaxID=3364702 RepID=UPI0036822EB3